MGGDWGRSAPLRRGRTRSGSFARILYVDDQSEARAAFGRALGSHGFLVDLADGGPEAISRAQRATYPIVVTDLSMPGMGGVALIRELHAQNPATVFVIATGCTDVEIPNDPQLRSHVASIVSKPIDVEEIAETLHRCLRLWEYRSSRPPPCPESDPRSEHVLLLEDDDADAALIETFLEASPHRGKITRKKRLSDALALLEDRKFGVIVADLSLPDARGLDSVRRVQNVASNTPLIVMSGLSDDEMALQAVQAGAQDYLVKGGVDAEGLLRSIRYAQERKRSEVDLTRLAYFDPLTGLANRAQFEERLAHTLSRARRTGEAFAVMFLDLDQFKPVNDQHGHPAGDQLLLQVSHRLQGIVREYDVVARLGGDEFAIILDNLTDASEVTTVAERMLESIGRPYDIAGNQVRVTASIGVAFHPDSGSTAGELVKAADHAMYEAKRRGRNTYEIARDDTATSGLPLLDICTELKEAVRRGEFALHYQPQFDVARARVLAAEGLLRWRRGGERLSKPAEFLHLLEETGQIREVGAWVICAACADMRRWRQGASAIERVSVNVSARQLDDGSDLLDTVRRALNENALDASCLEIEVTESSILKNETRAREMLSELKSWGARIAMDDFGTGFSALSHLYRLPIDTVKIDQSFVRDLRDNGQCQSATRGIIAMTRKMGLSVVAEGVETEHQRGFLEREGCDVLQGYLFGKPMSASQIEKRVPASVPPVSGQRPRVDPRRESKVESVGFTASEPGEGEVKGEVERDAV